MYISLLIHVTSLEYTIWLPNFYGSIIVLCETLRPKHEPYEKKVVRSRLQAAKLVLDF